MDGYAKFKPLTACKVIMNAAQTAKRIRISDFHPEKPVLSLNLALFPDRRLKCILAIDVENLPDKIRALTRAITSAGGRIIVMRPSNPMADKADILYYIECREGGEEETCIAAGEKYCTFILKKA